MSGKSNSSLEILVKLYNNISGKNKKKLFLLSIVILFSGLFELISLASVVPVLQALNDPSQLELNKNFQIIFNAFPILDEKKILALAIFFMVASIVSGGFRVFNLWLNTRVSASIASEISHKAYSNSLRQPYLDQLSRNSSLIVIALTKYINSTIRTIVSFLQMYTSGFIAICLCTALTLTNWKITIFIISSLVIAYYLISFFSRAILIKNSKNISNSAQKTVKITQESLGSIRDVIMTNSYDFYEKSYTLLDQKQRNLQSFNWFISGTPKYIIETLSLLLLVGSGLLVTFTGLATNKIIPLLGFFALAAQRLLPSLQQIYGSWSTIKGYTSDVSKVISLLSLEVPNKTKFEFKYPPSLDFNTVEFVNVSFSYPMNSKPILKNLNLKINAGEKIGLVGTTGSGKSTFVNILMGLVPPTSGSLLVDGVDITLEENYTHLLAWRSCISQVPQEVSILELPISQNIAFGDQLEDINQKRLYDSAKKANLFDFIDDLSDKFSTILGENGTTLSGGQKQRIGLARAFYRQSKMIILDEATSALDTGTESVIIDRINNFYSDFTIIAIAHRLNTLNFCDCIFEVKDGTLTKIDKSSALSQK